MCNKEVFYTESKLINVASLFIRDKLITLLK